jgi:hypothetical protein
VTNSTSRALVPLKTRSVVSTAGGGTDSDFLLVDGRVDLKNRDEVKERLPDILGRVLARAWLDKDFLEKFREDPLVVLENSGVHLPETMHIEFQKANSDRPKVVVFEQPENSKLKLRVFYLQLVMVAGR